MSEAIVTKRGKKKSRARISKADSELGRQGQPVNSLPLAFSDYRSWLVFGLAFVVYASNLFGDFVYDDRFLIEKNKAVQGLDWAVLVGSSYWGELVQAGIYRPLTSFSFGLNRLLTGSGAFGFHLVNNLLHSVASLMVYLLAGRLAPADKARRIGFSAGLLFAVHPVHTEAVTGIVGRSELLAFVFFALAFWFFSRKGLGGALPIGLCFFAALASKESAIFTWPLFLASAVLVGRWRHSRVLALGIASGLFVLVRVWVLGGLGVSGRAIGLFDNPLASAPMAERFWGGATVIAHYGRLLVWPWPLSADYSFNEIPMPGAHPDWVSLLGLALLSIVAGVFVWALRAKHEQLAFAACAILFPLMGVVHWFFPLGTLLGERLVYLPSVGVCLAVAWAIDRYVSNKRGLSSVMLVSLVAVGSGLTVTRNADWKDNLTLFKQTAVQSPDSARAHFLLGYALAETGEFEFAAKSYGRGLKILPDHVPALYSRAEALAAAAEAASDGGSEANAETIAVFRRIVALEPTPEAYEGLGVSLYKDGEVTEALDVLLEGFEKTESATLARRAEAIAVDQVSRARQSGQDVKNIRNVGDMLERIWALWKTPTIANELGIQATLEGRLEDAASHHRDALDLDEDNVAAKNFLGVVAERRGRLDQARRGYEEALAIDPSFVPALLNLGSLSMNTGDLEEAERVYRLALESNDRSYEAHNSLGIALARRGRRDEAATHFRKALELAPDLAAARENLIALGIEP